MAVTKAKLFETSQKRTAELMKALGHPARIAIVELLAKRRTCICGDITDELPLAQSTVSQHLKALKEAGIVQGTVEGRSTCYCLDPAVLSDLRGTLDVFFGDLDLSVRASNCLESAKINTLADLVSMPESELLKVRSFGKTSLREVKRKLTEMNLELGMELPAEVETSNA